MAKNISILMRILNLLVHFEITSSNIGKGKVTISKESQHPVFHNFPQEKLLHWKPTYMEEGKYSTLPQSKLQAHLSGRVGEWE